MLECMGKSNAMSELRPFQSFKDVSPTLESGRYQGGIIPRDSRSSPKDAFGHSDDAATFEFPLSALGVQLFTRSSSSGSSPFAR